MMDRFTSADDAVRALAAYAPQLAALRGKLPVVEAPEPDDIEVRLTPSGPQLIVTLRDSANGSAHRFGPFDPREVSGGEMLRACLLRVHAPFN
jgi:hypothetical protein